MTPPALVRHRRRRALAGALGGLLACAGVLAAPQGALLRPAWAQEAAARAGAGERVGRAAPPVRLEDPGGKALDLAQVRGKVVVLEWIAATCPYVAKYRERHDVVPALAKKYREHGVVWWTVASGREADRERLRRARERLRLEQPILLDPTGRVARAYGVERTPHVVVLDARGVLRYEGAIDDDASIGYLGRTNYLDRALAAVLADAPVEPEVIEAHGCPLPID